MCLRLLFKLLSTQSFRVIPPNVTVSVVCMTVLGWLRCIPPTHSVISGDIMKPGAQMQCNEGPPHNSSINGIVEIFASCHNFNLQYPDLVLHLLRHCVRHFTSPPIGSTTVTTSTYLIRISNEWIDNMHAYLILTCFFLFTKCLFFQCLHVYVKFYALNLLACFSLACLSVLLSYCCCT